MLLYCAAALVAAAPAILYLYSHAVARVPRLYAKPGTFKDLVAGSCEALRKPYVPLWWAPWGMAQTAVRQIFNDCPTLPFEREVYRLADGGQLALDWLSPPSEAADAPLVIVLPGLTGHTHNSCYILHLAQVAYSQGYRTVVYNMRGNGDLKLLTPTTYCAAYTDDVQGVLDHIHSKYPAAPRMIVGFSMGGMITWNYMAKLASAADARIKAALIVSAPWDPMDATFTFEAFWPKLFFNGRLTECLRGLVAPYRELFGDRIDFDAVMQCETVRDFDRRFIVPMFGYKDWPDYYRDAALNRKVHRIPIPTLCLNSCDDCFSPTKSIPYEHVQQSENVAVVMTTHGGHTAFLEHTNPSGPGLIESVFADFSQMVFRDL